MPIQQALSRIDYTTDNEMTDNQLILFNF